MTAAANLTNCISSAPGGSTTSDGKIEQAAFSAESWHARHSEGRPHKNRFTPTVRPPVSPLVNISTCGETLSFDLLPVASRIYLPTDTVVLAGNAGSTTAVTVEADTSWQITSVPEWHRNIAHARPHRKNGPITITALTKNENTSSRNADIILNAIDEADVSRYAHGFPEHQVKYWAPSNLSATVVNGKAAAYMVGPGIAVRPY